jgi:hypothetical protein
MITIQRRRIMNARDMQKVAELRTVVSTLTKEELIEFSLETVLQAHRASERAAVLGDAFLRNYNMMIDYLDVKDAKDDRIKRLFEVNEYIIRLHHPLLMKDTKH